MEDIRLVDELGRVALPAETRRAMGWGEKTPVEIFANATAQEIVIRRHALSCARCGSTKSLREYRETHLCADCRRAVAALR